ncbi:hypothetical protein [Novosphingobium pentaromativorans]|uniref:Uncharacterized protein n=1 Tax=Novosphingobium pentaromativorans US6-1 TaxID=1088721 RepID=G6EE05_9SPHN|nr:hypothetical protein [Novosphingobium pentaromativorans]AIT79583.1 hypothetical protein JI59_07185 [Novosphingobium pentaromativorans US6-1]EHJ60446.1 hypothetical protein NSU_2576 [Novosphingobium pentaromativorans US6-1]
MKSRLKSLATKIGLGAFLAASTLALAAPAEARDRHHDGDDAAIAIGAGLIGLAVGAALADDGDRYYYDRDYYPSRRYVTVRGYPGYYYYYEGRPNRYYRDRYYDRYYGRYHRERWSRDRDWRHDRRDWRRDRRDWRHDRRHRDRDYRYERRYRR